MKTKHALIIFALGILLSLLGALFRIMHWPAASTILVIGTIMEVVGGLLLLFKILTNPKFKELLNS